MLHKKMRRFIFLFFGFCIVGCSISRPKIECFDPNNFAADTSYYIQTTKYEGFIFPAFYKPMIGISENRFTPKLSHIQRAEKILENEEMDFGSKYKRQYLGSVNNDSDTLITIRLMKNGFKEECFDKIVAFGFGERFEKNQRIRTVNLNRQELIE